MGWDREKERKAGKNLTIGSSVFGLIFAIFWCCAAVSMGAGFMLIFGIPFVGMMIYRLYVLLTLSKEDQTPKKELEPRERPTLTEPEPPKNGDRFCPYCGEGVKETFSFCPKCGRRL